MPVQTLSSLDRSFLDVESPAAHMHVGWGALFDPPEDSPRPTFEQFRAHIGARLGRAPRYRQRLQSVPLGLGNPAWVDDDCFDLANHVHHVHGLDFSEFVDGVMSQPLEAGRPLWELWIAPALDDGRVGVVGKVHHCMVDGLAAVELATLLLDPTPEPEAPADDDWRPAPVPDPLALAAGAATRALRSVAEVAIDSGRIALSPERARALPGSALRAARALAGAGTPARQVRALNAPISPSRHLARVSRPLSDLKRAGRSHGVTVNDVLLSASATGLRHLMERRGESPGPLKAMVPVSLRSGDEAGDLGNRISFVFAELPCHDPDPTRRLARVHDTMRRRKEGREPEGADDLLRLAGLAPRPVQRALSRLVASPLVFNLTVSNVPGPIAPMFMRGCELRAAYPVVPIADHHDLSIGMTTVGDRALVGVYADSRSVPDADHLAADIGQALDELALERDFAVAGV